MATIKLEYLAPGVCVSYTYEHYLNNRSSTMISKYGTVIRTIRHRNKLYAQKVAVLFDGNKEESIVDIEDLRIAKEGK